MSLGKFDAAAARRGREGKGRGQSALAHRGARWAANGVAAWIATLLLAALLPVAAAGLSPDGAVMSWGDNSSGQLGRAGNGGQTPGAVPVETVVGLTGGRAHSVAVLADGTLKTWGANVYGELGDGSVSLSSSTPSSITITDGTVKKTVVQAAAGGDHTLALTSDGQVWAWGLNTSAQLAIDPNRLAVSRTPQKVAIPLPAGVTISQVAAGDAFSLALASDGVVWGWGDNTHSQLGPALVSSPDGSGAAPPLAIVPTRVGITGVTAIGAGINHSLAITTGGQVWTWGDNSLGQLRGDTAGLPEPMWRQVQLPTGAAAPVAVDGGRGESLALLADGRVLAWGDNSAGQLGKPATTATAAPDYVPGLSSIASIDSRYDTAVAVERHDISAALWTWGANGSGQLGHAAALTNAPAAVSVSNTSITAASGDSHTLVALAPRASVSVASLTFPGSTEVGTTSTPLNVTVTDNGPGSLRIGTVAFQPGQSDYAFAAKGDGCSGKTLASGSSCTVAVVFKPVAAGPRDSYLTIDDDAYGSDPRVDLHGQALVLSGGIGITADPLNVTNGVAASPSAVPLGDVPLQPLSPNVQSEQAKGNLPAGDATGIGTDLPIGDITGIGTDLPIGDITGIGTDLPIGDITGIGTDLPIGDITGIGTDLPIGDITGIGGPAKALLSGLPLSTLPLVNGYAWDGADTADAHFIVSGSPALHGQPLQDLTLLQALSDTAAAARFSAMPARDLGWSASRLGQVGALSFLLGGVALNKISGHDWCGQLNAAGLANCGSGYGRAATPTDGLTSSAFEFDMSGLRVGSLDLASVQLGQIAAGQRAPVLELLLSRIDLYRSDLGSILVSSLDAAGGQRDRVVDCAKTDCTSSTATLASAQAAGAVKSTAMVGDLGSLVSGRTVGRIFAGLMPQGDDPYGRIPLTQLGIQGYGGNDGRDSHRFGYTATFTNTSGSALPTGTTMSVKLPPTFTYVQGSTSMSVKNAAGAVVGGPTAVGDPTVTSHVFTWAVPTSTLPVGNGDTLVLTFSARPGMVLGTYTVNQVSVQTPTRQVSSTTPSAPVRVVDGLEPNDTPATATPITPSTAAAGGELKVSHVSSAGDRDFFSFNAAAVPAGSQITVHLDHQTNGDADLLLYGAPGMAGEAPLRAPAANGVTPLKERIPTINGLGTSLESDVQSDLHRDLTLPLLGISQNRGTVNEAVTALALTPGTTNDKYVVEVEGYNGALADTPYSLRITVTQPPAALTAPARTFPNAADPTATLTAPSASSFSGINTLFLTANGRIQRLYGSAALASVTAALNDTRLSGIIGKYAVLSVDANDGSGKATAAQQAYAAWDANPADPTLADNVVRAVNAQVDRLVRPNAPALQNIVVIGNDDVIPMARINDLTSTVNERLYARELAVRSTPANALVGAAASGRFLSDDGLADFDPTPMPDAQYLYLPSVATGRLVDTPTQIVAVLNQFMQYSGVVNPTSALTTSGAGFLDDLASGVDAALAGKGLSHTTLTTSAWSRSDLVNAWGANPGVVSFNGHSDASLTSTRTAQTSSDLFSTNDVPSIARELVVSVGCHTGLPVADGVLQAPVGQSWGEALLSKGASGFAGQTGYGLGSKSTVALSEKVVLGFVQSMGTTSLGNSLVAAKQAYADDNGPADVLDAKALMEATYYGMPQLRFANAVAGPPAPPALPTGIDPYTGLNVSLLHANPAFTKNVTADGTYYSVNGKTVAVDGRPVQPLLTTDVTRSGLKAHGVAFTGLTSTDVDGTAFDPVLPRPVTAGGASPDDELQVGDVTFPAALQAVRSNSGRDEAEVIPALFQSTGVSSTGKTVGHERRFTSLDATVLYSTPDNTDFTAPTILDASAVTTTTGNAVTFVADTTNDAADVSVLYKEDGSDVWHQLHLAKAGPTGTRWAGGTTVSATKLEYFVQAVDSAGNVAVMANKGRLLTAQPIGASTGGVTVKVSGVPAPANTAADPAGWLTTATVSLIPANPATIITARVDGGPAKPVSSVNFAGDGVANPAPDAVIGDGYHTISYSASDGSSGVVVVRIDNKGPAIKVNTPAADGSSFFMVGQSATASFRCTDSASGLASPCTGSVNGTAVNDGGTLPTDVKPEHALVITAKDLAGNTSTLTVPYQVGYRFDGFLQPVLNRPALNYWQSGQTVPMKWRLYDANNNAITATSTFVGAGTFQFACSSVPPPGTNPGTSAGTQSGIQWASDHFQYGWNTASSWAGTCQRFVLRLDDGTFHLADFQFT
jgi:alpha-tubulin suppressor-like RCC1 family protein